LLPMKGLLKITQNAMESITATIKPLKTSIRRETDIHRKLHITFERQYGIG